MSADAAVVVSDDLKALFGQEPGKRKVQSFGDSRRRIDLNHGFRRAYCVMDSQLYRLPIGANGDVGSQVHKI